MAKRNVDTLQWLEPGWQPAAIGFFASEKAWAEAMDFTALERPYPFSEQGGSTAAGGHCELLLNKTRGTAVILVGINPQADDAEDPVEVVCTLVHEASHAFDYVCLHMGEDAPGEETKAYALEHIVRELLGAYSRTLGRGKTWPK